MSAQPTTTTTTPTEPRTDARLASRAREARALLVPQEVDIPAPRGKEGVTPPPRPGTDADAPAEELVADLDTLATDLAVVEEGEEEAAALMHRLAGLVSSGIPEAGWSIIEGVDTSLLRTTSEQTRALHTRVADVLTRLDDDDRLDSAVPTESLATTLLVVGVVLDLEVFEREH